MCNEKQLHKNIQALYKGFEGNKCLPCFGQNLNLAQEVQDRLEEAGVGPERFIKVNGRYDFSLHNGRLRVNGSNCYTADDIERWIKEAMSS
ncbi:MAG: hypothetical protein WCK60_02490 [Candidatus Nomurabacteria bacterium]